MSERATRAGDAELLERVALGDRGAFEEIYRCYARAAYGLASRRVRDPDRAVEAVQEVFISVRRSAGDYRRGRETAARWLFGLAWNVVAAHAEAEVDRAAAAERAAWDAWRVHRALEELPEHDRDTLVATYWSEPTTRRPERLPARLDTDRTRSALLALTALLEREDLA